MEYKEHCSLGTTQLQRFLFADIGSVCSRPSSNLQRHLVVQVQSSRRLRSSSRSMTVLTCCALLLLCFGIDSVHSSAKFDRPVSRRLLTGDSAQVTQSTVRLIMACSACKRWVSHCHGIPQVLAGSNRRTLTQSTNLAQGLYHIQSASRLQTCWNYLSVPNCTIGDTADLYYQDDGSGRQQFYVVPLPGKSTTL